MKLSFSTRGWRDLSWQEILDTAEEMGFQGVEFYHVSAAPELTDRSGPFHAYSVASAYRTLREKHLSIPCFDSACDISTADEARLEALREEMRLCSDLRAPFCAVWASGDSTEKASEVLAGLTPLAEDLGVTLLIKTCGLFSSTERLRALLDDFACDQLAVLWDVHHPYRDCGETPAQTITNLGAYVKHVHLRDSSDSDTY